MAPHSSTLAWKIPWTEEPGGLQSMGSRKVGHDWSDLATAAAAAVAAAVNLSHHQITQDHFFLSISVIHVTYPYLTTTWSITIITLNSYLLDQLRIQKVRLHLFFHSLCRSKFLMLSSFSLKNFFLTLSARPRQCSCLENPRDGAAWWAAIYGVA